jgi:hypothetical protein
MMFKNHCTCGGFAWTMNGRDPAQPHMAWCPQLEEYAEWYKLRSTPQSVSIHSHEDGAAART